MKTLEERIEAVAEFIEALAPKGILRENAMEDAETLMRAGFPELFDGSHVLMPREPTEEMLLSIESDRSAWDIVRGGWRHMISAYEKERKDGRL